MTGAHQVAADPGIRVEDLFQVAVGPIPLAIARSRSHPAGVWDVIVID
jgi:hypothetical protein